MIGIEFEHGGEEYTLAMTTNAMARYEAMSGESALSAFARLEKEPSILMIRGLFWSAVTPSVSEDQAGDMIDDLGFAEATKMLGDAATRTFEGLDEKKPKKPRTKTR